MNASGIEDLDFNKLIEVLSAKCDKGRRYFPTVTRIHEVCESQDVHITHMECYEILHLLEDQGVIKVKRDGNRVCYFKWQNAKRGCNIPKSKNPVWLP